jgi:hypothetical protein
MCAPLGAILYPFFRKQGRIKLTGFNKRMMSILRKNGFLPNFGFDRSKKPDIYGTTIEYQRFGRDDSHLFKKYVAKHFVGKGIPTMSQALHKKFRESISEIFENAVDHSNTQLGIFACGQLFPGKSRRLDFSIADLGIGIRNNISYRLGIDLTSEKAIEWAMDGENTTRQRQEGKPGGLGLKLIREFIRLNGGVIQIISDNGYWSFRSGKTHMESLSISFPGTVVNIEINTADTQSYCLASEIDPKDIF